MKKKILYLMHIPWGTIKQRPHFVAENISNSYDVVICFARTYRNNLMVKNATEAQLKLRHLFVLPFARFQFISRINSMLIRLQLIPIIPKVDIIWITHPYMFEVVKNTHKKQTKLIYDCMDDALEFPSACGNYAHKKKLFELEKSLIYRCDIVFISSDYLSSKLTQRYGNQTNIHTINNAISMPECNGSKSSVDIVRLEALMDSITGKKVMYLGAISEWMDFDLILSSVERIPGITYVFVGACYMPVPRHERLIFFGPIEHHDIFRAMKKADALIMPFRVNELIKSVNPVKIYDYIYSCRPAVVVGYGETEKFEDFIHLYRTSEEYMVKLEMLVSGNLHIKKSSDEHLNFISNNTWPIRVKQMLSIVNSLK